MKKRHSIKKIDKLENITSPIDRRSIETYNELAAVQAKYIRLAVLSGAAEAFTIFSTEVAKQEGNINSIPLLTLCAIVNGFFLLVNSYKAWVIGKDKKEIKELYEIKKEIETICKDELGMSDEEFAEIEQQALAESEEENEYYN